MTLLSVDNKQLSLQLLTAVAAGPTESAGTLAGFGLAHLGQKCRH